MHAKESITQMALENYSYKRITGINLLYLIEALSTDAFSYIYTPVMSDDNAARV